MPIDASIALGYRPPQVNLDVPSPIQQFGQMMSLRQMMEQSQARQMDMQEQRMKMAAAQRAQQDDQILRQSYADAGGDLDKTQQFVIQRGGSPKALQDLQQHAANLKKTYAETSDKELGTKQFVNSQYIGAIDELSKVPDDQYPQAYTLARQNLLTLDPKAQIPEAPIPRDQLGFLRMGHITDKQAMDAEQAKRDALKTTAEVAAKNAETVRTNLAAQQMRRVNVIPAAMNAFQKGPQAYQEFVQTLPEDDRPAFAGATKADDIWKGLLTAEQRQQAEQSAVTAAETARQHAAENAISRGHLEIARKADARAEQVYQNTYGAGANEALVGVDPKLRVQATSNAQKAADEYTKASESTANMQAIIDLARSGNKIAYAYAPTTGVLTINTAAGVKRVNMPEIKSYGGAGSAMDRLEGWLGKETTGASIPKDILANMEQVNKSISDSAASTYNSKLDSINQNYHSNFKPAVKPKAPASAGGHVIEINGKHYQYKGSGKTDDLSNYSEVK